METIKGNIVDLGMYKDKENRRHMWSIMVTHLVDPSIIEAIVAEAAREDIREKVNFKIPMGEGTAIRFEGPGCLKCRGHWSAVWNELCPISDKDIQKVEQETP